MIANVVQQDTLRDQPKALRSQPDRNTFDASLTLAEQYKVSDRTIKNHVQFTVALDTLASAMGEELKH